jgi:hypothetical protein
MTVNVKITPAGYFKVKKAMLCKAFQHMIEKSDPGFNVTFSGPIDRKTYRNIGLFCLTCQF